MKNSIKREQSQACLNFAERKNFRLKAKHKILMTLALLLTAVTGAWADGTLLTTITASADFQSGSKTFDNIATVTLDGNFFGTSDWAGNGTIKVTPVAGVTITSVKFFSNSSNIEDTAAPFQAVQAYDSNVSHEIYDVDGVKGDYAVIKIEVFGTLTVEWDAATKTGTFKMPAFDVEIAPIYAPTAMFATDGNQVLTPTAAEGIYAESTDAIVKAGTVAKIGQTENLQGTLMYAVGTSATEQPALTTFSATLPTAKDITTAGDVYVWYYIKGADTPQGETATAENTFNDSEICAEPIKVTVLNNKFDINFKAANANTIEAKKATVKVGDEAATVTEGKLESVKMGSEVKITAKEGYKFRKVEVKKNRVAEGHALTLAKFGEIVCSDSKAYAAADKDILPKGVKAEALVCYVDGEHGLALAMADVKNEKMSWDNNRGANDGKTAAEWCTGWNTSHPITGATWLLASQTQWQNMINAAGSASNLSNAFSAVGGTNLQAWSYWSSTPHHGGTAAYSYYFPSSSWQWTYLNQDYYGSYIRACLEW